MSHAPHFDHPNQFDQKRIRLAYIDGSGVLTFCISGATQFRSIATSRATAGRTPTRSPPSTRGKPRQCAGDGFARQRHSLFGLVVATEVATAAPAHAPILDLMGGAEAASAVKTINITSAQKPNPVRPLDKFYCKHAN